MSPHRRRVRCAKCGRMVSESGSEFSPEPVVAHKAPDGKTWCITPRRWQGAEPPSKGSR